jgi:phosphoglycolate phosphatase
VALRAFDAANIPIGLCTSKRADFAESILKLFGIRQYFRFVSGGDIGVRKVEQLASLLANEVIAKSSTMIGDRAIDVRAAKENGLNSVAVLWGYGSLEELRGVSPGALLESPHELLALANAA